LTYDSTTGHSALWYYDNSNSPAQFREIISSESISIIASEFDRVDQKFTDLNSELESLTAIVDTKVSQEELDAYNFATEEEASAFALAAISNVQGNATNDTSETLTIQGTRKYVDAIKIELNSEITSIGKSLDSKTTLQEVKDYIIENKYTTESAVSTAISNAEKAIKEYTDKEDQKITSRVATLEQNIGNLSNIMNFLGVLTIDLNHEATNNPITINGNQHTAVAGDVVIDKAGEEFVFDGSKWQ